ncbi:hypothetical protein I5Q34_26390 [Streptomyces sp. AV19]|uniref:PEP/pyruvate-binding domain-containing protein n=1 Tax=Streptomyces sp. AV19 TaxID=2793068 RepID=UPI0018FE300D|nr:PEP/pyruvate-binding domain-containing protein [Streptomyces sp. AV19]MBH1937759.1 hypothetical protein [Streptomyces sp. AV19]MDG4536428.1 PEP-utilizing enzyme [Streptomyces sp. AV19]
MTHYIRELAEVTREDGGTVGGKAARLGEAAAAGLPVPAGFVVAGAAYRDFLGHHGIGGDDPRRLGELIRAAEVPEAIARGITDAYRKLGAPRVAVRSSATVEDLADASFAGQYDTFLGVEGEEDVVAAVRACWASLWTARATDYRLRRQPGEAAEAVMGVLVMPMVDARWAGVLFTADPVTGRRDRITVDAVEGLGEALVSGRATGVTHVVDRADGRLLSEHPSLPAAELDQLVRLAERVEALFGGPQDIEWACAGGRCWLLQARPMTGLPDAREDDAREDGPAASAPRKPPSRRELRKARVALAQAEHYPVPHYPMDCSVFLRPVVETCLGVLRRAGVDAGEPGRVLVGVEDAAVRLVPPGVRPTPRVVLGLPLLAPKALALTGSSSAEWTEECRRTLMPLVERIDGEELADLTDRDLTDRLAQVRGVLGQLVAPRFGALPRGMIADASLSLWLRAAFGAEEGGRLHADLLSGVPTLIGEADRELAGLAARIHREPELREIYERCPAEEIDARLSEGPAGRALLTDLRRHLARLGYRMTSTPSLGSPTLRDSPQILHGLLLSLSRAAEAEPSAVPGGADRMAAARTVVTSARGPRGRLFGRLALRRLPAARAHAAFREDSHFYLVTGLGVLRLLLLERGRRLVERGSLDRPEDVFLLELPETDGEPEPTRALAADRKRRRAAVLRDYNPVPPDLLAALAAAGGAGINGIAASRGTATGPVRVISGPAEFHRMTEGDVLVCPYTNPGWTPLFRLARAVVTDTGGLGSHAAVVAREYGIPAVMGTVGATRALRDGQYVRVDGTAGTVGVVGG